MTSSDDGLPSMSDIPWSPHADRALIDVLTPEPTGEQGRFIGVANPYGLMGIYGGHWLGQALCVGLATVEPPKVAHSLHAYFLRKGDPDVPIEYEVTTLRDGRGSSTRSIAGFQHGRQAFHMMASFKLTESGDEHQPVMPDASSAPELIAAREEQGDPPFPFPPTQNGWAEMEWVSPSFREYLPEREPRLRGWMRIPGGESLDERQRQVVLAYVSDAPIVFNSVLPHGLPFETHVVTSLDHSLWFHRPFDPSQWMLFDQLSTAAGDGRGMNEGRIFDAGGGLLATCAQESMLRRLPDS